MKRITIVIAIILLLGAGWFYKDHLLGVFKKELANPVVVDLQQLLSNDGSLPGPLKAAKDLASSKLTVNGVVNATNGERLKEGLPALTINSQLSQAAEAKITDMFKQQYFEHVSPQGVGPSDLAETAGYEYIIVGENLALGNFGNDIGLVTAWMNSPGHRENILNHKYQQIGVAVRQGMYEGKKTWLAVQEFGTPLSACPDVDLKTKRQIEAGEAAIEKLQADAEAKKAELDNSQTDPITYNKKVEEYNAIIRDLNAIIDQVKILVARYNEQVNNFNACLEK